MPSKVPASATKARLAAIALLKIREKNRIARKHLPTIRAFFKQQRNQVLERIAVLDPIIEKQSAVKTNKAAPKVTQAALDQFSGIWAGIEKDTQEDLQDLIKNIERDSMQAGGDQMAKTINPTGKFWDLSNPRAVKWFQEKGGSIDYIKGIQQTTADSLKRVITTALDEGWSYQSTAREIQKLYDGPISRDRAQRIAVFETGQAYEAGNRAFADTLVDDGVEMEEHWMSSHDERVRPAHDNITGNESEGWVPLGHVFSSGDTEPPTDPGCRCYMIYREAKGGNA